MIGIVFLYIVFAVLAVGATVFLLMAARVE